MGSSEIHDAYKEIKENIYHSVPEPYELDRKYMEYEYCYLESELYAVRKKGKEIISLVKARSPLQAITKVLEE